jgi:putative transcriptional regulator
MRFKLKNRLSECLLAKKINKSQFARRLEKSRAYVTRLMSGSIGPSLEMAFRIARYFGRPVEEIFQLAEDTKVRAGTISRPPSAEAEKPASKNAAEP